MDEPLDCVIVGGGPAGLTAAIYLARFRLSVRLFDSGDSRVALIPCTRNHAGYPDGIAGNELLDRMVSQALKYGVAREPGEVTAVEPVGEDFRVRVGDEEILARSVLIATGVVNHHPEMPEEVHVNGLQRGLIRYCPICDGYEVTDKKVAVIGTGDHGMREAIFLRGFTADLTLIALEGEHALDDSCAAALEEAGIARVDGPSGGFAIEGTPDNWQIALDTAQGRMAFDSIYPAMGSRIRSRLAVAAGANASEDGCMEVDSHQRTSVRGLYAAGDVVKGLDQISHAMGEAGVAAVTIRNDLAARRPIRR